MLWFGWTEPFEVSINVTLHRKVCRPWSSSSRGHTHRIHLHNLVQPHTSAEISSVWVCPQTKASFTKEHRSYWPYQREKNAAFHSWHLSKDAFSHTYPISLSILHVILFIPSLCIYIFSYYVTHIFIYSTIVQSLYLIIHTFYVFVHCKTIELVDVPIVRS